MKFLLSLLPNGIVKFLNKKLNKYTVKHGSLYDMMFNIRMVEAALNAGKITHVWIGDSRFAEFEPLINDIPGHLCLAISGSKVEDWIARGIPILKALKAPIIFDDIIGNDYLGGASLIEGINLKIQWMNLLQKELPTSKVWAFELCPITAQTSLIPKYADVNLKIAGFNAWFASQPYSEVKLNDKLAPSGVMLPEYAVPDGIHWSAQTWDLIKSRITSL